MYHGARTARDRDRLRASVLEGLGWKLHRIWSIDWWQESERCLEAVLSLLGSRLQEVAAEPEDPAPESMPEPASRPAAPSSPPRPLEAPGYVEADLGHLGSPGAFREPGANRAIRRAIAKVLEVEAPIAVSLLARRVAGAWGIRRLSAPIRRRVEGFLPTAAGPFLWRDDQDRTTWSKFRRGERKAEEIPPEEIAAAAHAMLRNHVSLSLSDLSRETARLFGIQRLGPAVAQAMEHGIGILSTRGHARMEGGSVTLVS